MASQTPQAIEELRSAIAACVCWDEKGRLAKQHWQNSLRSEGRMEQEHTAGTPNESHSTEEHSKFPRKMRLDKAKTIINSGLVSTVRWGETA